MTGFYFLRIGFLVFVLAPLKFYTRFGHITFSKMYKKLFYGEILLILIEGYLDFTIAFFLYIIYDESIESDSFS